MIFENNDFGVGGNINFFTEANFILMNKKSPLWTRKSFSKYLHSNKVDIRSAFWDLNKYMMKSCSSWKSTEHHPPQKKNWNFLIPTSNHHRLTKFTSIHMFLRITKGMKYSKKKYVSPKLSKSKMAANYDQRFFLGIKSINMPFLILP